MTQTHFLYRPQKSNWGILYTLKNNYIYTRDVGIKKNYIEKSCVNRELFFGAQAPKIKKPRMTAIQLKESKKIAENILNHV